MKKMAFSIVLTLIAGMSSFAQTNAVQPLTGMQGFISYKIFPSNSGIAAKPGYFVKWDIQNYVGDVLQSDSRNSTPVYTQLDSNSVPADYLKIFYKAQNGDSIAMSVPIDSATRGTPNATHDGKIGYIRMKLLGIYPSKEEATADQALENKKMAYKDSIHTIQQQATDSKLIQQYVAEKKLKGFSTRSGMFVAYKNKGTGKPIVKGEKIKVNYTGATLDGIVFDSNVDPKFGHVTPYEVAAGIAQVIMGWNEGLLLFNKGGEGTLIIPSALAYGSAGYGGAIGPDAVLVFDMKVLDDAPAAVVKPKPATQAATKPKSKH